ncbi:Uncharacterized protein DAT39_004279 [Clarias magur]|uniref:Uncharacterized protein n=1 Tax=Clarias magur TaxID=1594786 RepID=A0A8J4TXP1_CLAMG|nr:Uncharacterized protein DAT39_004279 [Clarias magur]
MFTVTLWPYYRPDRLSWKSWVHHMKGFSSNHQSHEKKDLSDTIWGTSSPSTRHDTARVTSRSRCSMETMKEQREGHGMEINDRSEDLKRPGRGHQRDCAGINVELATTPKTTAGLKFSHLVLEMQEESCGHVSQVHRRVMASRAALWGLNKFPRVVVISHQLRIAGAESTDMPALLITGPHSDEFKQVVICRPDRIKNLSEREFIGNRTVLQEASVPSRRMSWNLSPD